MQKKVIIHTEYDLEELAVFIQGMKKFSTEELRLWIIQELANFGHERWAVIDIAVQVLKSKIMGNSEQEGL